MMMTGRTIIVRILQQNAQIEAPCSSIVLIIMMMIVIITTTIIARMMLVMIIIMLLIIAFLTYINVVHSCISIGIHIEQ